jgi:hypothetical protein
MQLTAKLHSLLPLTTGSGKNGPWKKQDIIVETEGTYPKKICISVWGDKIDEKLLIPGSMLRIDFDIESREYNGRWYTDIKAWRITPQAESSEGPEPGSFDSMPPPEGETDLPF